MLRTLVKNAAAHAVSWARLDKVARARVHRDVPFIVCYHRVVERLNANDGFALPAMEISVATLERQIDWIGRHFRIVSLDELPARLEEPAGPIPLAAITFDDGYSDVFHHAFPLLRRKGVPAAMFVVTDLVDSEELPTHERLHALLVGASRREAAVSDGLHDLLPDHSDCIPRDPFSATRFFLERLPQSDQLRIIDRLQEIVEIGDPLRVALRPLTWAMITEMRRAGMTIGSHSRTHAVLTRESEDRALDEAAASRRELQRRLGTDSEFFFAYPDGGFNRAVVEAVARAGYRYAFTICPHRDPGNPMLTIPRTPLWEQSCLDHAGRFSPPIMSCHAAGMFGASSRCTEAHA